MNGYANKSRQDHKALLRQPIGTPCQYPAISITLLKQRIKTPLYCYPGIGGKLANKKNLPGNRLIAISKPGQT